MRIWMLNSDVNNYDNLKPIYKSDWDKLIFNGVSLQNSWVPVPVTEIERIMESDAPGLNTASPVLSLKAVEVLKGLMGSSVEILPLRYKRGEYFAINVIEVIDCIDYDKADFERFSTGEIMMFNKYAFRVECLKGKHIFKIIDEPERCPFVSDEFKEKALKSGLTGFDFELVWDSKNQ